MLKINEKYTGVQHKLFESLRLNYFVKTNQLTCYYELIIRHYLEYLTKILLVCSRLVPIDVNRN